MSLKIFKCLGANGLIGAIGTPLGDCFLKIFLEYFSKLKKLFIEKNTILLRFVLKICHKYIIFKVFKVHFQVLFLLKSSGYKLFYTAFEGPNVNEIIPHFLCL